VDWRANALRGTLNFHHKAVGLPCRFCRKTSSGLTSATIAGTWNELVAIPTDETELIRLYTLSEQDISVIKQRRGDANRLGFAVLLCWLRYPGYALAAGEDPPHNLLTMISAQLGVEPEIWAEFALGMRG
jgi:hypothetical protein